ncbi:MAG: peptide chain release factor 3, partial [Deltaproteobacteria bacterium]
LQFEVVQHRLESEYGVKGTYENYPFQGMRWPRFKSVHEQKVFISNNASNIMYDNKGRICFSVRSEWDLKLVMEKNPDVEFFKNSDYR